MKSFSGKPVGYVITEFYGPIQGRNFNHQRVTAKRPGTNASIFVRVIGSGKVKLQYTNEWERVGLGQNPIAYEKRGKNWKDVSWLSASSTSTASPPVTTFQDVDIEIDNTNGEQEFVLTFRLQTTDDVLPIGTSTILQDSGEAITDDSHLFVDDSFCAFRVVVADAPGAEEAKVFVDAQWS